MKQCLLMAFVSIFLAADISFAAAPSDILGLWHTAKKDAKIEIYKCGKKYCGKIVWLKESRYPAGSKEGVPGTPILDSNNPNPVLRNKPLVGVKILIDFVFVGPSSWENGRIYNSDNGKVYSGKMTLISRDKLNVRGFIDISLVGGSTTWTRVKRGT
jgi:uncharacterized protein (DUF2147 family)